VQQIGADDGELSRLSRVARNRSALWVALVMSLIGLIAFVVLFNVLLPSLGEDLGDAALIGFGLFFSVAPAGLWLGFFYRLDRYEPEPKRMVLGVYVLGALVTAALHQPVLEGVFSADSWLYDQWWTRLLGGILVVGVLEQFLVYLVVRFSIFGHPEFDQRVDGVIYAMAAGLGVATVLNFQYVIERGGVDLDIGSIRMVVNALAFASFAGVQGYFIGQARFESTPVYYLPGGLAIAAVLNGLFFFVIDQGATSLRYSLWLDLLLAGVIAVFTLAVVFWLIARDNEETLRVARQRAGATVSHLPLDEPSTSAPVESSSSSASDWIDPAPAEPDQDEPGDGKENHA
jgi:RsiW-degrading membrane proteinase PrsW (M82 family)